MLTDGFNHVAVITTDLDRFIGFYTEVFGAVVKVDQFDGPDEEHRLRMAIIDVGPHSELNVFEMPDNPEATRQTPMFGRGRLDHIALQANSMESFLTMRDRLMQRGATDDFVTDFGSIYSLFFRDPDGLECELCVTNSDHPPGTHFPPGTRATRFS